MFINSSKDYGDYKCKAENDFGTIERVITINAGVKPDPPTTVIFWLKWNIPPPHMLMNHFSPTVLPTRCQFRYIRYRCRRLKNNKFSHKCRHYRLPIWVHSQRWVGEDEELADSETKRLLRRGWRYIFDYPSATWHCVCGSSGLPQCRWSE